MSGKCIFKKCDKRFSFQVLTADKLVRALSKKKGAGRIRGAVLGDGVGMGKTYTSLFTALSFMSKHLKAHRLNKQKQTSLLIVVPNDVILRKWQSEIEPYAKASNLNNYVRTLKKSESKIRDKLLSMTQSIVTFQDLKRGSKAASWSIILLKRNQLRSLRNNAVFKVLRTVVGFIIFDEAHHLKEPSIVEAFDGNVGELLTSPKSPKFLFLTATPFQKDVRQMKTMFCKEYFLDKENTYVDLCQYIDAVREYIKDPQMQDNGKKKERSRLKKDVEKELRTYFVVNGREVLKKKGTKRVEYINGEPLAGVSSFDDHMARSKRVFCTPDMRKKWDDFQRRYLAYRFDRTQYARTEVDLTRFTSFSVSQHRKHLEGLYPLKLDLLKHVIERHFDVSPSIWNQKFVVFCDMLNDNPRKKDSKLHKELKRVVEGCLNINPVDYTDPPDLSAVLTSVVGGTALESVFFATDKGGGAS